MLGNFTYYNPTKIYFGKTALNGLNTELKKYGKNVMLVYGGGSIKRNGIYDKVIEILKANDKLIFEFGGIKPNPTLEQLYEGIEHARAKKAEFILAVGGGSVCDYAKALAASVNCDGDPWEKYFMNGERVECEALPLGCVLTMVGTASEMNPTAVITNEAQRLKMGRSFGEALFPKFSILNPEFTFTLPKYQMVAGIYDIFSHVLEQYLSGNDDNTSDYIAEGLLHSLIRNANIAVENPLDYEARSNIMWTATWALNTLIEKGKPADWMVHMLGQAVAAYTDATHGMTLAAVSLPYYRHILEAGVDKFARFAVNVWGINPDGKSKKQTALEGLQAFEKWMRSLGLVMNITELGATQEMLDGFVASTRIQKGGYKVLDKAEIREIFKESL